MPGRLKTRPKGAPDAAEGFPSNVSKGKIFQKLLQKSYRFDYRGFA